jgi:hypothetical protein
LLEVLHKIFFAIVDFVVFTQTLRTDLAFDFVVEKFFDFDFFDFELFFKVDSEIAFVLVKFLVVDDGVNFLILIDAETVMMGDLWYFETFWFHERIGFVYKCRKILN